MKLVKCDKPGIRANSPYKELIDEFLESDMDCARVEEYNSKSYASIRATLDNAIKRYGMTELVKTVVRNKEIYLVKL